MKKIINQVHNTLLKNKKTIAVAESCTGGLASSLLTRLSGSSEYFALGIVAYSNKAKTVLLGIPKKTILKEGTVSKEVAQGMSQKIRKIAKTDFGIGITGIAGPTGATPKKPIGTVFIAVASRNKTISRRFVFKGNREAVRKASAIQALKLLKNAFLYRH